ncbi:MAG: hypothetical protein HYV75_07365 [Opitutae bacterium]|nr:hypothetical protein [Opitutae bacterium]
MNKVSLLAALLLLAATARAGDPTWHLSLQVYSLHEHTTETELTNNTPGLGLMYRTDDWFAGAGVFRNSVARTAGYAYVGRQWPVGRVQVGGIAGLTHHYNFNNGGIVPLGAAVVSVPLAKRWALDLVGIPRIGHFTYATLNFSLRWQFR